MTKYIVSDAMIKAAVDAYNNSFFRDVKPEKDALKFALEAALGVMEKEQNTPAYDFSICPERYCTCENPIYSMGEKIDKDHYEAICTNCLLSPGLN